MADTGAFNQASIALLRSLGFRQDGCLRQHQLLDGILHNQLLFSLLAEECEEQKVPLGVLSKSHPKSHTLIKA